MPNRINQLMYKELAARYADSPIMVLLRNEGISTGESVQLRNMIREQSCRIQNIRNRIANLVFKNEFGIDGVDALLSGPVMIIDGDEPGPVAKLALKVARSAKMEILGAVMEKKTFDAQYVKIISTMPTRLELIGMISGQATSPFRAVSAQAIAPHARLASQIQKIADGDNGDADTNQEQEQTVS